MKILWFTGTPSLYANNPTCLGGWIESLERIVAQRDDCRLAIAFEFFSEREPLCKGNVTYYPIHVKRTRFQQRYIDSYTYKYIDEKLIEKSLSIIEQYKPDVIQVFGSELWYGMLAKHTKIPVVVHMQGCWPVYKSVMDSQKIIRNLWDVMHETWKPQLWWRFLRHQHRSAEMAKREEEILQINRYFMGRTRWDKALTRMFSPESQYFLCNEALRRSFVESATKWTCDEKRTLCRIVTVGNSDLIKGYDLTVQTAKILKERAPFDFEWNLIGAGVDGLHIVNRKIGIAASKVNVVLRGTRPADEVRDFLLDADMFVQTSMADNSPNAVCEAQYLGLPVISTYVGGVPSLFSNEYDRDLLVPLHDPYYLAAKIIELFQDKERMKKLSSLNYEIAHSRHNDAAIEAELMFCYTSILQGDNL